MSARRARPVRAAPASPLPHDWRPPAFIGRAAGTANRVASSKLARTLVTLVILAIAALLIRGELKSARFADITHAIAATPPWAIALAAAFTAATYACEGVIEWYALRYIGKRLPLGRTLAAASGASALSIAMGFGLASGTAARLRFYTFAGLEAADVAKVTGLVSAATFLIGLLCLGFSGFGGMATIGAMLHWPGWGVALLSVLLLAPLPVWFALLNRWPGNNRTAPAVPGRTAALTAGVGNWVFQGAAMFVLASHDPTRFAGFFAAFTLASLIGSVVGVPADLGVLEAGVLGSHALGAPHQAAAALLLYRVIFQLVPLLLATAALVLRPAVDAVHKAGS
jgi:phosphatidylglycerol lysyltransferase